MIFILSNKHYKKVRDILYSYIATLYKPEDNFEKCEVNEIITALNFMEKENG